MLSKTARLKKYGLLTLTAALSLNTLLVIPTNAQAANDKVLINSKINLEDIYKDESSISSWAKEEIRKATEKGYIAGNNAAFRPKADITRAEFTKIMVSVLDLEINKNENNKFNDIEKSNWFYPYATAASKAGIVSGDGSKFRPNDNITREQMASIIVRSLNLSHKKPETLVKDMDMVSTWAKAEVETVIEAGLIQGNDGYFNPKAQATREMAAAVAMRASDYIDSSLVPDLPEVKDIDLTKNIEKTAQYLNQGVTDPVVGVIGGEWIVLGLSRSNSSISDEYYDKYYSNIEKILIEKDGKLHPTRYTDYDRVILALTSLGKDVKNVAGYNLLEPLADYDKLIKQGINGPIFTLIALDSNNYEIPQVQEVSTQTTRDMLIDFILNREIEGGGWNLNQNADQADTDITAMSIQALTPYYKDNNKVKDAVDRGLEILSNTQRPDGGYQSMNNDNLESSVQVLVALSG